MEPASHDSALEFAIAREEAAVELYTRLARGATRPGMQEAFFELANEERSHRARLVRLRGGPAQELLLPPCLAVSCAEEHPPQELSYPDLLRLAMRREERSVVLYTNLAGATADRELARFFSDLARAEEGHRLRLESEYLDVMEGV